ncbi:MAG: hypothetical protein IIA33_07285, partial [Planctomycetes bacterium]|nr:hypothetical protein [Planctomycetota bacterium]
MNLAIALTAGNYKPPLIDLPACDCDADLITAILEGATGFDDKLIIRNIRESAVIKKRLTEFIAQHKQDDVE